MNTHTRPCSNIACNAKVPSSSPITRCEACRKSAPAPRAPAPLAPERPCSTSGCTRMVPAGRSTRITRCDDCRFNVGPAPKTFTPAPGAAAAVDPCEVCRSTIPAGRKGNTCSRACSVAAADRRRRNVPVDEKRYQEHVEAHRRTLPPSPAATSSPTTSSPRPAPAPAPAPAPKLAPKEPRGAGAEAAAFLELARQSASLPPAQKALVGAQLREIGRAVQKALLILSQGLGVWACTSCGPLVDEPIHGKDERMHCPNDGCDAVAVVVGVEKEEKAVDRGIGHAFRGAAGTVVPGRAAQGGGR